LPSIAIPEMVSIHANEYAAERQVGLTRRSKEKEKKKKRRDTRE
jgi:hypothetical protein